MQSPLVSIILSTYNGNHTWISESIESVLTQSYDNFELIIINDASINDIEKTILKYASEDDRIIYKKNILNLERSGSRNEGINMSIGKYIAIIDDDDIWADKNKLKKQVDFMENHQNYGICGTSIIYIDTESKEIGKYIMRQNDTDIKENFLQGNQFAHSSIIIRKSILSETGVYDISYRNCEDYELIGRIGRVSKLHNINTIFIKYRINPSGISILKAQEQIKLSFKIFLLNRKYYPNKISNYIYWIISIYFPKNIKDFIKKILKKIKLFNKYI